MCNKKKYINPFSQESKILAKKLDDATIVSDHIQIEKLLYEVETMIPNVDAASQAQLYYSIGTIYSDFAKFKGLSHDESIRKQLYCFRKSVDIIEAEEYAKKRI